MPATIKINDRLTVQVPGTTAKEIIQGISFWNTMPKVCGACKSPDVTPNARTAKGFLFMEMLCLKCHHTLKISEGKETHEPFIRWDAKWESPQQRRDSEAPAAGKLEDEPDADWF